MFRNTDSRAKKHSEEENPFLLSFSDLMASLVAIFILALIVMMIQLHLKQQELKQETQAMEIMTERMESEADKKAKETERLQLSLIELRKNLEEIQKTQNAIDSALDGVGLRERNLTALLEGIQKDLQEKGIEVIVAENGSVLRIPERALSFGLGSHTIDTDFHSAANAIGDALLMALRREENLALLDTVFIEGHTDAVPNNSGMGNWGLSAYRAISLWKFWTETPGECEELQSLKTIDRPFEPGGKPLISVSGYAETRPTGLLSTNSQEERGNAADRRIDIRFTLASAEKRNLEDLKSKMSEMKSMTQNLIDQLKEEDP